MAKQGDWSLSREMGGKAGKWLAKQGEGWLRREIGGLKREMDC